MQQLFVTYRVACFLPLRNLTGRLHAWKKVLEGCIKTDRLVPTTSGQQLKKQAHYGILPGSILLHQS